MSDLLGRLPDAVVYLVASVGLAILIESVVAWVSIRAIVRRTG